LVGQGRGISKIAEAEMMPGYPSEADLPGQIARCVKEVEQYLRLRQEPRAQYEEEFA
jgi:hypothetical protein